MASGKSKKGFKLGSWFFLAVILCGLLIGLVLINSGTSLFAGASSQSASSTMMRYMSNNRTASSCKALFARLQASYGKSCPTGIQPLNAPQDAYDPIADVNKDKTVNIYDFSDIAKNYRNESWCSTKLADTTNPCAPADTRSMACNVLYSALSTSLGKSCGQSGYDDRVDFNNDNNVNTSDFSIYAANFQQNGWCERYYRLPSTCSVTNSGSVSAPKNR